MSSKRFKIIPRKSEQPKVKDCVACNGTGYYDHDGSPPCQSCEGTGKVTV